MDLKKYGITDAAVSIPGIHQSESTHNISHRWIRNKVTRKREVMEVSDSNTFNSDSMVSQFGEDYTVVNGTWVFNKETPDGIRSDILYFNDDGTLKMIQTFAPSRYKMEKAAGRTDVHAAKLASTFRHVAQKPELQMTSILGGCEVDHVGKTIDNVSLLDLLPWHNHPNLATMHMVEWHILNLQDGMQSTGLIIEARSIPGSSNVNIIIRKQAFVGEPKPAPIQINGVGGEVMRFIRFEFDTEIGEAEYIPEGNKVFVNPDLTKCQVWMVIMPTDQVSKRENDNSPVVDIRTGASIGNW